MHEVKTLALEQFKEFMQVVEDLGETIPELDAQMNLKDRERLVKVLKEHYDIIKN